MTEVVFLVEESSEGGYCARAVGESIHTQADTIDELRDSVRDAIHCHFDDADRPKIFRLHFVRDEVLPV